MEEKPTATGERRLTVKSRHPTPRAYNTNCMPHHQHSERDFIRQDF
jgi:hypothetical protein